jgi:hypothetical protein
MKFITFNSENGEPKQNITKQNVTIQMKRHFWSSKASILLPQKKGLGGKAIALG